MQTVFESARSCRRTSAGASPHGICIDSDRVWVTDSGMHMVHLLTTADDADAPAALQVG